MHVLTAESELHENINNMRFDKVIAKIIRVQFFASQRRMIGLSSSRMHVINHNWSATKPRLHPQNVAEISRHSVLSGDRIRQCGTSFGSRHKDTDQCL